MRFDIGSVRGYVYRLAWLALLERERGEVLMHRELPLYGCCIMKDSEPGARGGNQGDDVRPLFDGRRECVSA